MIAARKGKPDDLARMEARTRSYMEGHAAGAVEGMISAANLAIAKGHTAAAVAVHAEICRRYPTRIGVPGFADLDSALHDALLCDDTTEVTSTGSAIDL